MYRTGEIIVPTGMASWFSIENWRDGNGFDLDGNPIIIKRIARLMRCAKKLRAPKWVTIVKSALEIRSAMENRQRKRKGKQRAVMAAEEMESSDEGSDDDIFSDPIEPATR